jgi:hypothetical protein
MKKIALAAAALLTVTGAAFAENPYVGGSDINTIASQQAVDATTTSSVHNSTYELLNAGHSQNASDEAIRLRQRDFGNH